MGQKLYPPYIDGTLPAFTYQISKSFGKKAVATLRVPFTMNRAVGVKDFIGFSAKIKTIDGIMVCEPLKTYEWDSETNTIFFNVDFEVPEESLDYFIINDKGSLIGENYINKEEHILNCGQYYKIQIAYISKDDTVGYYSTVGVTKFTGLPQCYIDGFEIGALGSHKHEYIGYYIPPKDDTMEKMYSGQFIIYDHDKKVIDKSENILCTIYMEDEDGKQYVKFKVPYDLQLGDIYFIQFEVLTVNNLIISTPLYRITQTKTIDLDNDINIEVKYYSEDAYVDILVGTPNTDLYKGTFSLMRHCSDSSIDYWEEIMEFKLYMDQPLVSIFKDFSVKQGYTYTYAVQWKNDYGIYSNRKITKSVYVDFEHMYLWDGKRQLCLKYNPKMSTYKKTVLEQKQDTLGSKYPFIFRNGIVGYKEFSISGLISVLSDERQVFKDFGEITEVNREKTPSSSIGIEDKINIVKTDLVHNNITKERAFKNDVLEWLNDGKIKLLRTSTEGNFLVRVLNVSMSPEDSLGRMLHNVSGTVYEVDEFTLEKLKYYKFIPQFINPYQNPTKYFTLSVKDFLAKYNNLDTIEIKKYDSFISYLKSVIVNYITLMAQAGSNYPESQGQIGEYYLELLDKYYPNLLSELLSDFVESEAAIGNNVYYSNKYFNTRKTEELKNLIIDKKVSLFQKSKIIQELIDMLPVYLHNFNCKQTVTEIKAPSTTEGRQYYIGYDSYYYKKIDKDGYVVGDYIKTNGVGYKEQADSWLDTMKTNIEVYNNYKKFENVEKLCEVRDRILTQSCTLWRDHWIEFLKDHKVNKYTTAGLVSYKLDDITPSLEFNQNGEPVLNKFYKEFWQFNKNESSCCLYIPLRQEEYVISTNPKYIKEIEFSLTSQLNELRQELLEIQTQIEEELTKRNILSYRKYFVESQPEKDEEKQVPLKNAYYLRFDNFLPGASISIDDGDFVFGRYGTLEFDLGAKNRYFKEAYLNMGLSDITGMEQITIGYESNKDITFAHQKHFQPHEILGRQEFGYKHDQILDWNSLRNEITYVYYLKLKKNLPTNIIFSDLSHDEFEKGIKGYHRISLQKGKQHSYYVNSKTGYSLPLLRDFINSHLFTEESLIELNKFDLSNYKDAWFVCFPKDSYNNPYQTGEHFYLYIKSKTEFYLYMAEDEMFKGKIKYYSEEDQEYYEVDIDVYQSDHMIIKETDKVKGVTLGPGLALECSYLQSLITYDFDDDYCINLINKYCNLYNQPIYNILKVDWKDFALENSFNTQTKNKLEEVLGYAIQVPT